MILYPIFLKNSIVMSKKVGGEDYDPYEEYHYFENRRVYGESLIDSLERTVQTQEDQAIINDYRKVEGEVSIKRSELAALNNEIYDTIYTPMDQEEAAKRKGLEMDKKAFSKEIRKLSKEIKKDWDNISVYEGIIKDPSSTPGAKSQALIKLSEFQKNRIFIFTTIDFSVIIIETNV